MRKVRPLRPGARRSPGGLDDRAQARATPPPGPALPSCRGTRPVAWSRSTPSPPGPTTTSPNYEADHGLPMHPLVSQGYLSIGCAPTTRPVAPGEDPRAGRWSGMRTRPSAACTSDMARRSGRPSRGRDPGQRTVHALRAALPQGRRAEPGRALEARAPSPRGGRRRDRQLRQGGRRGHRQGGRRAGAAQVGRSLPPAPGWRRLHDAGQGARGPC